MSTDKDKKVTFDDVAGLKEEKEELEEMVDFLKNPQRYTFRWEPEYRRVFFLVGLREPVRHYLPKAVAGEAGVPFFTISGSDFVEMFVGVGASRVCVICLRMPRKILHVLFLSMRLMRLQDAEVQVWAAATMRESRH